MRLVMWQGKGLATGDIPPQALDTLRSLPGFKKRIEHTGNILFELTAANLLFLQKHLKDAEWDDSLKERLCEILEKRESESVEHIKVPDNFHFDYKGKPYDYQEKAFYAAKDKHAFAYFMEQGTGKTYTTLCDIAWQYQNGIIDFVLIFAPNGVHSQWVSQQIPEHLPDWVPRHTLTYRAGMKPKDLKEFFEVKDKLHILSMNIESQSHKSGNEVAMAALRYAEKPMIVVDESTRIKTPGSKRTKAVIKLGQFAKVRRILTGSPVTNGVEDLYSQLKFLDPDILGYSSFYTFRNHFCIMGGWQNKQIVDYQNMEELKTLLKPWSFRITKEDALDLPERTFGVRHVDLSKEQKALYHKMKEELFVELDSGHIVEGALAVTKLMRLQQILCGHLPDDKGEVHSIPDNRIKAVEEIVEECQNPVIIWARFRHSLAALEKALKKYNPVRYDGSVKPVERDENVRKFQSGESFVFIGQPQSAGTGLNLMAASNVIWHSPDFSYENYTQANDRCYRIGQGRKVTYTHLVTPGTIDMQIMKALKQKHSIAKYTVDDVKEILEKDFI